MENSRTYLVVVKSEYIRDMQVKVSSQGGCDWLDDGKWKDFSGQVIVSVRYAETKDEAIAEIAKEYEIASEFLDAYILSN